MPINYHLRFFLDVGYDWAWGEADVTVQSFSGRVIDDRSDEVDLSALQAFAGFSFVY
jgi:hypothetical protein